MFLILSVFVVIVLVHVSCMVIHCFGLDSIICRVPVFLLLCTVVPSLGKI
jgi:hypothetical protein